MTIPRIVLGALALLLLLSAVFNLPGGYFVLGVFLAAVVLTVQGMLASGEPANPTRDDDDGPPPPVSDLGGEATKLAARRASRIPHDLPASAFTEMHLRPRGEQAAYQAGYELMMRGVAVRLIAVNRHRDGFGDSLTATAPTITYTTSMLTDHMEAVTNIDGFAKLVAFRGEVVSGGTRAMPGSRDWWSYQLHVWSAEWDEATRTLERLGYRLDPLFHPSQSRPPTQELR